MAKTAKRKRLTGEERREQILEVGLQVFARHGFEATTLDEVAAEAGITKPIIYDYFETKQAFFDAIMDREWDVVSKRVMTGIDPESDVTVVDQAVRAFFEYLQERPNGFRAMTSHAPISWFGDDRRSELRRKLYQARVREVAVLLKHFDDPTDPEILTLHIVGSMTFVGEHWLSTGCRVPVDEVVEQLVALIRLGLPAARNR